MPNVIKHFLSEFGQSEIPTKFRMLHKPYVSFGMIAFQLLLSFLSENHPFKGKTPHQIINMAFAVLLNFVGTLSDILTKTFITLATDGVVTMA